MSLSAVDLSRGTAVQHTFAQCFLFSDILYTQRVLLLALMGALALDVIHAATGVSLGGNVVLSGKDDDYVHFIYFSLVSLTTVGFGDIYAVSTSAGMLATFLSTVGVLFPAIVIARLVGLASSPS